MGSGTLWAGLRVGEAGENLDSLTLFEPGNFWTSAWSRAGPGQDRSAGVCRDRSLHLDLNPESKLQTWQLLWQRN
uniref:Uncharacterized protein n=1 Tax=Knipowitschia caucasica TaxID=637954 RepID=A0AAV2LMH0_KNICA